MIEAALGYAALGFPVFPCRPTKAPYTRNGFRDATCNLEQVKRWWSEFPEALIGMPTGRASGLVVIDCDFHKPFARETFECFELENGMVPRTVCSKTINGGFHYYLQCPIEGLQGGVNRIGPGVDVLGDGQYVILPPSRTGSTGYCWEAGTSIQYSEDVAALPAAFLSCLERPKPSAATSHPKAKPPTHRYEEFYPYLGMESLPYRVLRTERGEWLTQLLCDRLAVEQMAALLGIHRMNSFRCVIPGHDERNPSASIHFGDNGVAMYCDRHGKCKLRHPDNPELPKERLFLGEVYGFQRVGYEFQMGKPETLAWSVRLALDSGVVQPLSVLAGHLPDDAPLSAEKVFAGWEDLLKAKALFNPNRSVVFTSGFVQKWCGVCEEAAKEGLRWLRDRNVLVYAGKAGLANSFLPGDCKGDAVKVYAPESHIPRGAR